MALCGLLNNNILCETTLIHKYNKNQNTCELNNSPYITDYHRRVFSLFLLHCKYDIQKIYSF